jgi:hypothetical protein
LGTTPTLGDVRPESEKRSKPDIERTSPSTSSRATSKVIGRDEGAGTEGGSALGERERVLPLLAGARSRFLEHRVGDPELAMPLATEPGAVEQPKVDFLGL